MITYIDIRLTSAKRIKMDADNSCLLHSVAFGAGLPFAGHELRVHLYNYLTSINPNTVFNWTTGYRESLHTELFRGWNMSILQYGDQMKLSHWWCGCIELTLLSNMLKSNISVFKIDPDNPTGYIRYSFYNYDISSPTINVVWINESHYDVLINVQTMYNSGSK
jgi:hypothetical protein